MAKLHKQYENENAQIHVFHCPGCKEAHSIRTRGEKAWEWNGNVNKPTFSPSISCNHLGADPRRCHSFVRDGNIQFLDDCWHDLKNQTVEIPEWDVETEGK